MRFRNSGLVSFYSIQDAAFSDSDSDVDNDETNVFQDIENEILTKTKIEYAQADKRRLHSLGLSEEDSRLKMVHSWSDEKQHMTQTIQTVDSDEITVDILLVKANVSQQKRNLWNSDKTNLKSQEENVSVDVVQVAFLCIGNDYSVIIHSADNHILSKITSDLIGQDILIQETLDLSLFSWLWWKYSNNNREISSFFKIPVMTAFVGNIGDMENDSKITGKSEDIGDMGAVALHVATDEKLRSIGLQLIELDNNENKVFDVTFKFDEFSTIMLNSRKSFFNNSSMISQDGGLVLDRTTEYMKTIVYIYAYVIPKLKDLFFHNQDDYEDNYLDFRNDMALKVYRMLLNSGISETTFSGNQD